MSAPGSETGPTGRVAVLPALSAFVDDPALVAAVSALGRGNINDTYLVTVSGRPSIVVQRLSSEVFPDPACVADNGALVAACLGAQCSRFPYRFGPIRFPEAVATIDNRTWFRDPDGAVWRALSYIDRTVSYPQLTNQRQAFEAGRVLGCFHTLLEDFDTALLCEALPGFHDLNSYRDGYLRAISRHRRQTGSAFSFCRTMIEDRLEADSLSDRAARTGATVTVTHGDPKLDNFLFDPDSHEAVSLIDLDTTSSGPAVMDIGDCLRSLGNPEGEKGARSAVRFDCRTVERFLDGYGRSFLLGDADRHLIYHAVRMLTYELGLRFFTDYLEGDRYFKVGSADENLRRAVVQFTLLASIEAQRSALEAVAWAS